MKHKRRGKKRKGIRGMKRACLLAQDELESASYRAELAGIVIKVRYPVCRGRETMHVMFQYDYRRLLDWWPGTGRVLRGRERLRIESFSEAMALAIQARDITGYSGA